MTQQMQNAINQIFENKELSKKLIKLDTINEIFEFFKSLDNNISKKDFEEGINEMLEKSGEKLTDETLSAVSGGTLSDKIKKPLAVTLAALSLGSTPIQAAPKTKSKASKIISTTLLTLLGVTSASALGATIYYLINKHEKLTESETKKIYYEILKNLNEEQIEETCEKFKNILVRDNITSNIFSDFFIKEQIEPENLSLQEIETLLFNKEFFYLIPPYTLHHILPKEVETEVQKILSHKKTNFDNIQSNEILKKNLSSFKGLPNVGCSCHLNSTLQLIRQIPEIRKGNLKENGNEKIKHLNNLMRIINTSTDTTSDNKLTNELTNFISILYPGQSESQQDASETLTKLGLPCKSLGISIITTKNISNDITKSEENPFILQGSEVKNANYKIFCTPNKGNSSFPQTYKSNGKEFELKCIVCHLGGNNGGHYYVYSKDKNGVWYECNDRFITETNFENIKNYSKNATMLLYSKKN